jgi:hypothetical protein
MLSGFSDDPRSGLVYIFPTGRLFFFADFFVFVVFVVFFGMSESLHTSGAKLQRFNFQTAPLPKFRAITILKWQQGILKIAFFGAQLCHTGISYRLYAREFYGKQFYNPSEWDWKPEQNLGLMRFRRGLAKAVWVRCIAHAIHAFSAPSPLKS